MDIALPEGKPLPVRSPHFKKNIAAVYYTSGSTGNPKGVLLTHDALANRLFWAWENFPYQTNEICCQRASTSFIASTSEIFSPLLSGHTLILVPDDILRDPLALVSFVNQEKIGRILLTPSLLREILYIGVTKKLSLPTLKLIELSGEAISHLVIQRFKEMFPHIQLSNRYGLTEAPFIIQALTENWSLENPYAPIGKPIGNVKTFILGEDMKPVPIGSFGELYVAGLGISQNEYLHLPKLNEERFIKHKLAGKFEYLFKTGDIVRYSNTGNIEYVGRADDQLKIRGMKIVPAEIASVIQTYNNVKDVAVLGHEKNDEVILAAYITTKKALETEEEKGELIEQLRARITQQLPSYMLPNYFVFLDKIPLLHSGKLDRRALKIPNEYFRAKHEMYEAPTSETECIIENIWTNLLNINKVGRNDHFFHLGGQSLLASRFRNIINSKLSIELPVQLIFDIPILKDLAAKIDEIKHKCFVKPYTPITSAKRSYFSPLSLAQRRLWIIDQISKEKSVYNLFISIKLLGKLDHPSLKKAFDSLLLRHETLRTTINTINGEPKQIINNNIVFDLSIVNIRTLSEEEKLDQINQSAVAEFKKPFLLENDLLIRGQLLQLSEQENVLLITIHHIISDGWSRAILLRELSAFYNYHKDSVEVNLPALPIQYADYAIWQQEVFFKKNNIEKQLLYWEKRLKDIPELLILPTDKPRPSIQTFSGKTYYFQLSKNLIDNLNKLAKKQETTLFTLLLASFQILLYRYSNQEKIVVGTAVANRDLAEIENLIGFFVNTLPLSVDCSSNPRFTDFIHLSHKLTLESYDNQNVPFDQIVDHLKIARNSSYNPIFQAAMVLQNNLSAQLTFNEISAEDLQVTNNLAKFDLTLEAIQNNQGILLKFEYSTDLFFDETIIRFAQHYENLLNHIVLNPETKIEQIPLLNRTEYAKILYDCNETKVDFQDFMTIQELFEQQVQNNPQNIALYYEGDTLTYAELNKKSNQLADYLIKNFSLQPDSLIAVSLTRGFNLIIAILGVLKAGAAYVPLDPTYPLDRLEYILTDTKTSILLSEENLYSIYESRFTGNFVSLDSLELSSYSELNPRQQCKPEHLAYVIYTSGSTGKPKGVLIEHKGVINLASVQAKLLEINHTSKLLQFASMSFDAMVWEWTGALLNGASLYLAKSKEDLMGNKLESFLTEHKITIATLPPIVLNTVNNLASLKTLVLAGEAPNKQLMDKWCKKLKLINAYGPTESTVCASMHHYTGENSALTIGKPINNTQIYVLDKHQQPVPIGVAGELYIGGVGIARGYLNRYELTKEKFISNSFINTKYQQEEKNNRLYRTGDLVRYLADGNIEFLGRIDEQVKIRGFRVELGEIANLLLEQEHIADAAVILREDKPNQKKIISYIVKKNTYIEDSTSFIEIIKNYLKQQLPDYMIPSAFVILEKLPLTSHGKFDRKALPIPTNETSSIKLQANNIVEKELISICADLLDCPADKISITDKFFEMGMTSITIVNFYQRLPENYKQIINQLDLFSYVTVKSLAEHLLSKLKEKFNTESKEINSSIIHTNTTPLTPIANNESIAIIGIGMQVPGAKHWEEFWNNLQQGIESITFYSPEELINQGIDPNLIHNSDFVPASGEIPTNVKSFDSNFFDYSDRDALILDPQQRKFLETVWQALEDAGYDPSVCPSRIGLFAGSGFNRYFSDNLKTQDDIMNDYGEYTLILNNEKDHIATRTAFKLGLTGPAITIQTACSTGLVAIHQACNALHMGDCDLALAGAVSFGNINQKGYIYQEGMIRSRDGHCHVFDEDAQGTVVSQGTAVILLKPLSKAIADKDHIYAAIKGSAIL
ncbi:MAG: Linear gramicidin synthase subunit B [Legionellaceae bacterium]